MPIPVTINNHDTITSAAGIIRTLAGTHTAKVRVYHAKRHARHLAAIDEQLAGQRVTSSGLGRKS